MSAKNTAHPSASEHFSPCHLVLTVDGPQVSFCRLQMTPVHPHQYLCFGPLIRTMPLPPSWSTVSRWAESVWAGQSFMQNFKAHIASVRNQNTTFFLLFLSRCYSWMRRLVDHIQDALCDLLRSFPKHNPFFKLVIVLRNRMALKDMPPVTTEMVGMTLCVILWRKKKIFKAFWKGKLIYSENWRKNYSICFVSRMLRNIQYFLR